MHPLVWVVLVVGFLLYAFVYPKKVIGAGAVVLAAAAAVAVTVSLAHDQGLIDAWEQSLQPLLDSISEFGGPFLVGEEMLVLICSPLGSGRYS